jgi:protein-tyrosine-phosphatase
MAEAFARDWLKRNCPSCLARWRISSAGISAPIGAPASDGACGAVRVAGLSLDDHKTRRFAAEQAEGALVLTMTRAQAAVARRIAPRARVMTISAWAADQDGDVCDPYCGGAAEYSACGAQLRKLIDAGLRRMIRSLPPIDSAVNESQTSRSEPAP